MSSAVPISRSLIEIVELSERNVRILVAAALALPALRSVVLTWKAVPLVATTVFGVSGPNSRSAPPEPPTVTRTPREQLFVVSDSPDTASMQIPK